MASAPAARRAVEVLGRDDAADDDHEVGAAQGVELGAQGRHEGEVAGGERADADDVDVGLDGLPGHLRRRLEQRADVDVEAEVGEGGGDDLLAPVVAVLAHLRHEDPRATPLLGLELLDELLGAADGQVLPRLRAVHATDRTDLRGVPAEDLLHGRGHLADRRHGTRGVDGEGEQVGAERRRRTRSGRHPSCARARHGTPGRRARRAAARAWRPGSARTAALSTLSTSIGSSSSTGYRLTPMTGWRPASMRAWVRAAASSMRILGMPASIALAIPPAASTSSMCCHARWARSCGEPLHVGRAGPRVDDPGRARLLLEHELGVAGDARREVGGQRDRLVEGVGVQALGVALRGRHRLDAGAHDVVEDVLCGQRPARGLAVGAQRQRLGVDRRPGPSRAAPTAGGRRAASRPP